MIRTYYLNGKYLFHYVQKLKKLMHIKNLNVQFFWKPPLFTLFYLLLHLSTFIHGYFKTSANYESPDI